MPEQGGIKRYVQLLLDRGVAVKTERELQDALKNGTDPAKAKNNIREIERSANGLNGTFKKLGVAFAGLFATAAIINVTRQMWELASAAEETASKFSTTFGAGEAQVQAFIDSQGTLLGLNKTLAREMTATAGAIVQGMGMSQEASAAFSVQMVKAAGDLQSFHNVPIQDTFIALRAGLTGEIEPLRRFGVVLDADTVYMRALIETGKNFKDELTQTEIVTARMNLILERMGPALGDVERTQDSAANRARKLKADFENLRIEVAQSLMPAFERLITFLTDNQSTIAAFGSAMVTMIEHVGAELRALARDLRILQGVWEFTKDMVRNPIKTLRGPQARAGGSTGLDFGASDPDALRAAWNAAQGVTPVPTLSAPTPGESAAERKARIAAAKKAAADAKRAQKAAATEAKRAAAEARREAERAEKERIRELERAAAYQMRHFATPAMGTPNTQIQGAKDFGLPTPREQDVNAWQEFFWTVQDGAEQTGDLMADTFSRSFELLFSNLDNLGQGFADFFSNIAAGALAAMGTEARGRAQMSFADAVTEGAKALGALASGNVAAAGTHAAAAGKHMAAGAAWSAIAGGMGAGARGVGGGVGGGRISGGGYDRNPGGRYASQTEAHNVTYVYVDPFNPSNPVHSRQIGKAVDLNVQLSGKPAWVR